MINVHRWLIDRTGPSIWSLFWSENRRENGMAAWRRWNVVICGGVQAGGGGGGRVESGDLLSFIQAGICIDGISWNEWIFASRRPSSDGDLIGLSYLSQNSRSSWDLFILSGWYMAGMAWRLGIIMYNDIPIPSTKWVQYNHRYLKDRSRMAWRMAWHRWRMTKWSMAAAAAGMLTWRPDTWPARPDRRYRGNR